MIEARQDAAGPDLRISARFDRRTYPAASDPIATLLVEVEPIAKPSGDETDKIPAEIHLVLDVSGSMSQPNRYERVEQALRVLAENVHPADSVAISVFSDRAHTVLPPTPGEKFGRGIALTLQAIRNSPPFFGQATMLSVGLAPAIAAMRLAAHKRAARRIYVLTDGELHDSTACASLSREIASLGADYQIFGFGPGFNAEQLFDLVKEVPGGAAKPLIDTAQVVETFTHIAGTSRRIAALNLSLAIHFAEEVVTGDAFSFRPRARHLGRIRDRESRVVVASLELGRKYAFVYELRLPESEPGIWVPAAISATWEQAGAPQSRTVAVEIERTEGAAEAEPDPEVARGYELVRGLRDRDRGTQITSVTSRIQLCEAEGRERALMDALRRQLEALESGGDESSLSDADRKYIRCDEQSVTIGMLGLDGGAPEKST